jgi:predicted RNA-binding protein with PUA-like domain
MEIGDQVLFYHSNEGMEVVGIAEVVKTAYQDPTTDDERWSVVDLKCNQKLKKMVTLVQIKADEILKEMSLVKQSRLSVMPVTKDQFDRIVMLSEE